LLVFMGFIIGLLTVVMVLNCILLVFLVLIQLPKKEAGAGLAFGGAATDALFGAGSGTVLTKITKYLATSFFMLAVVLSVMQSFHHRRDTNQFRRALQSQGVTPALPVAPTTGTSSNSVLPITIATQAVATSNAATPPAAQAEATNQPAQ
jgi:preprotein translocase subunit SecG